MVIAGGPDEIAEQLGAFVDAGIEGFTISLPDASISRWSSSPARHRAARGVAGRLNAGLHRRTPARDRPHCTGTRTRVDQDVKEIEAPPAAAPAAGRSVNGDGAAPPAVASSAPRTPLMSRLRLGQWVSIIVVLLGLVSWPA